VVEDELEAHPGVVESLVLGVPDAEWGERLVGLFAGSAEVSEVTAWLRDRVPGHMAPKEWVKVPAIPRTSLGKPDLARAGDVYRASTGR
jgi:acyl-CoA synthetase (AMP-forming)/AMP-acid ligase II